MRLVDPNGVEVSVSDEKGARLLATGFRLPAESPQPVADRPSPTPRRSKSTKNPTAERD